MPTFYLLDNHLILIINSDKESAIDDLDQQAKEL